MLGPPRWLQSVRRLCGASSERRPSADRPLLHHDKPGALKMLDHPPRHDLRDDLICVVSALSALVDQREGDRGGDVTGVG